MYQIDDLNIVDELEQSYLEYSLSVIIGRAIPDVRDGLKPVHRRILYAMQDIGCTWNKPYKKSARIVGDVIGKYHPHGDSAVYDALVRMAQDFAMRVPLVDGQGNFGSIDGDNAAAMRYTEARMSKLSSYFLNDIEKQTVNFRDNYDNTLQEPAVLPTKVPNLLLNGTSGIAVGMATNIPPHNLHELLDGLVCLLDNPEATISDLMQHIPAPDFPTGGHIFGNEIRKAYETGHGNVHIRAVMDVEEAPKNRERIVVTEIPYAVNKENLVAKIADLINEGKIEDVSDLRDESDRNGIRIVLDLKKDAPSSVIISKLYKHTQLENTFSISMLAVNQGQPQVMNLRQILSAFLQHRKEVIIRRTKYELKKARERLHILEGLLKALDNIDEVVRIIRASKDTPEAKESLIATFEFSERQAKAILEMRLQSLTNLEKDKIQGEHDEIIERIKFLIDILENRQTLEGVIRDELTEIRDTFSSPRRSKIISVSGETEIEDKDMYPDEDVVITYSKNGYMKRVPAKEYRTQKRGGKGVNSGKSDDVIIHMITATNHKILLAFTNQGRVFSKYAYEIPQMGKTTKGTHVANIFEMQKGESVASFTLVDELKKDDRYFFFVTQNGVVKKTLFSEFASIRKTGKIATKLRDGDQLVVVLNVANDDDVMLISKQGKSIRFKVEEIREKIRQTFGVRGIKVDSGDMVVSGVKVEEFDAHLLTITENGFGKRSELSEYRRQARGGTGMKGAIVNAKTGEIINAFTVGGGNEEIILSTKNGKMIRFDVNDIRITGRATRGVSVVQDEVSSFDLIKGEGED